MIIKKKTMIKAFIKPNDINDIEHKLIFDSLYDKYKTIIDRCRKNFPDRQFKYYKAKGIIVEWKDRYDFIKYAYPLLHIAYKKYGHLKLQIDRINNDSNYCEGNIRFITPKENYANKSNNRIYEQGGENIYIPDLVKEKKDYCKYKYRLEKGIDVNFQGNALHHLIEYNGESNTIQGWSDKLGIPRTTIYNRTKKGRSTEMILSTNRYRTNMKVYS